MCAAEKSDVARPREVSRRRRSAALVAPRRLGAIGRGPIYEFPGSSVIAGRAGAVGLCAHGPLAQLQEAFGETLAIRYVKREPGEIVLDFEVR